MDYKIQEKKEASQKAADLSKKAGRVLNNSQVSKNSNLNGAFGFNET